MDSIDNIAHKLLLVRETKTDPEGREDKALQLALGFQTVTVLAEGSHVFIIQPDQVGTVGLDTGGSHRLGENGRSTGNCQDSELNESIPGASGSLRNTYCDS